MALLSPTLDELRADKPSGVGTEAHFQSRTPNPQPNPLPYTAPQRIHTLSLLAVANTQALKYLLLSELLPYMHNIGPWNLLGGLVPKLLSPFLI